MTTSIGAGLNKVIVRVPWPPSDLVLTREWHCEQGPAYEGPCDPQNRTQYPNRHPNGICGWRWVSDVTP